MTCTVGEETTKLLKIFSRCYLVVLKIYPFTVLSWMQNVFTQVTYFLPYFPSFLSTVLCVFKLYCIDPHLIPRYLPLFIFLNCT